jgi:hypothetical protein
MDKDAEIDLPFRFISNEEKKRRLQVLQWCRSEMLCLEADWTVMGENANRCDW